MLATALVGVAGVHPDTPIVEIRSVAGGRFGVLYESPSGDELLLRRRGGEPIVLGSCSVERAAEPRILAGGVEVSVVHRNCGATVEFATQVILAHEEQRSVVAVFGGRQPIRIDPSPESGLTVLMPALRPETVFRKETRSQGLSVSYVEDPALPGDPGSEYLDFSSFNYGATGRAAGMPAELLLRLAGWSQQAAGLSRPDWGRWSNGPPYGDDPRGSQQVANGIAYFESKGR